jgi:methionyl-tRNA formyltransferase
MNKLKVIFFGTPDFVLPVLESIHTNFELVGVVTTPDALVGRKQILTPSPIAQKAEELGIEVIKPKQFDSSTIEQLNNLSPDLFIVASYGKIIPQSVIDMFPAGMLNIHYSLLPKYRGASPVENSILSGDAVTGVTIQKLVFKLDAGPVVAVREFSIDDKITTPELKDRLTEIGSELFNSL